MKHRSLKQLRQLLAAVVTLVALVVYYGVSASRAAAHGTDTKIPGRNLLSRQERDTPAISRWKEYDWLPERNHETFLSSYVEHAHTPQWTAGERTKHCSEEAEKLNKEGVGMVQRHVSEDYVRPVDDPSAALSLFEKAVAADEKCWSARINLAILLPVTSPSTATYERMITLVEGVPHDDDLGGKSLLWKGIALELLGRENEAHESYFAAFELKPELAVQYFGKKGSVFKENKKFPTLFKDPRMRNEHGLRIEKRAMGKLLLYYEFARHFSGYNHFTKEQAAAFHDVWFTLLKDLIPPYVVKVLQHCYRDLILNGILKFDDKQAKRYFHYNSAPSRFIASVYTEFVSRVWDTEMMMTYTYMGSYPSGSNLKPHVDRQQCELTMTVSVDVNPAEETCPIGARLEPKKLTPTRSVGSNQRPGSPEKEGYLYPHIGDAVLFRGRGIVHWRDEIPPGMNCTNIFLHWVRSDFKGKID